MEELYDQSDQIDLAHEAAVTSKRVQWLRILADVTILAIILLLILILLLWWDMGNIRNQGSNFKLPAATGIADGSIGFVQLNPEIANYLRSALANQPSTLTTNTNNGGTTVIVPTGPCLQGGNYFCQDGNLFGTAGELGTNDANALRLRTNGLTAQQINPNGSTFFQNAYDTTTGFQVRNSAANNIFNVDTSNLRVGINTASPQTDLHVQGSGIVTGHTAIGPSATLGDGLLVTPLPPPFSTLMARRTQYVAETITDLSTAPPLPAVYVAQGNELLLNPTTNPAPFVFGGAYTVATVADGNSQNFGTVIGQVDGVVHKGSGNINSAYATLSGVINLDGGSISNAFGGVVGLNNNNPAGVIANDSKLLLLPSSNMGTINRSVGLTILDQAAAFGGSNNPLAAANIATTGAALNVLGGTTLLNGENSAQLTADLQAPYNATTRWQSTATLPTPLKSMGYAYANGYMYLTGGNDGVSAATANVYYSKIGQDGNLSWAATTPLPAARAAHRTFVQNGYIYVVGGTDGVSPALSTVYYARLNADGTVGNWKLTTGLPAVRSYFGGAQNNGYLYAVAGTDGFINYSDVFYARPNSDGTISSWSTSANPLPTSWKASDATVANGKLYYLDLGGYTVEYANLNPDGSNGGWAAVSTHPTYGTFNHTAFVNSGQLFRVGGDLVGVPQSIVSTSPLQADGDLGTWTEHDSDMPTGIEQQAAVVTDGYVYLLGGSTNGTNTVDTIIMSSTRRVNVAGALDLVTLGTGSLSDGGANTTLTAGNTNIVGALQVYGDTSLRGALSALSDVNFAGDTQLGGDVFFDQEVAHSIKLNDSTTAATAGAALSISGANGNGAAGGDITIAAGTGTTDGNILLNPTNGNVGVHNSAPGYNLHVGDTSILTGTTVARFENAGGTCDVTPDVVGAIMCTSDQRRKKNLSEFTDALQQIGAIQVYKYNLTAEQDGDPVHVGFLAQELEKITPDLVKTDKDGMKSVSYSGLVPYLVQAIKQQQSQIDGLKGQSTNSTSVDVVAELAKAKAITINGNLVVNGRVEFGVDNKGTAKVKAGDTKLKVSLASSFSTIPNVIISPQDFVDGSYRTTAIDQSSFVIELNKAQGSDVEFNWQAY